MFSLLDVIIFDLMVSDNKTKYLGQKFQGAIFKIIVSLEQLPHFAAQKK